ncbi:MAG: gamma-glutamyl-phosphate reductase, partial [Gammaproteobacteria bacterium]
MTAEGKKVEQQDIASLMDRIGRSARASAAVLARTESATKDAALGRAAELLESRCAEILKANGRDMEAARARGLSASMLDRLRLDEARVRAMAAGIRDIVALPDPVGQVMAEWDRPNGLVIQRVRVPLGVIGIVYESRPNVTADAGALCLKSG